jgi:hypothetical protein
MSKELLIGVGIGLLGTAVSIIGWLVDPQTMPYGFRFGTLLFGIAIAILGGVLIGKALWQEKKFCYFSLYLINGQPVAQNRQYQLAMTSNGVIEKINYWIAPWGVRPTGLPNDPYYSIDQRKLLIEIIHAGGRAWDRALPLGDYQIDFNTKYGNWYQRLRIYTSDGEVRQMIRVTTKAQDAGKLLYSSDSL